MSAMSVVNSKIKGRMRKRIERRPDEFVCEGVRIKARKSALSLLLAQRNSTSTGPQKGTKP
jgi:hypothetical protein